MMKVYPFTLPSNMSSKTAGSDITLVNNCPYANNDYILLGIYINIFGQMRDLVGFSQYAWFNNLIVGVESIDAFSNAYNGINGWAVFIKKSINL